MQIECFPASACPLHYHLAPTQQMLVPRVLFLSLSFTVTWKEQAGWMSDAVSILTAKRKHFHAPKLMTMLRSNEAIYHATTEEPNAATVSNINIHTKQVAMEMVTFCLNILEHYNLPSQDYEVLLVNRRLVVEVYNLIFKNRGSVRIN